MDKDFQNLLKELKEFNLPPDQFAIFGSGPARIRKLLSRRVGDLDLIVTKSLWQELSSKHPVKEIKGWACRNRKIDLTENIEVCERYLFYKPEEVEKLIREADVVDGIRFVKLEEVARYKKRLNRPKDRKDLKEVNTYLRKEKTSS